MNQNYFMVNTETNVVDNMVIWDGNTETWNPPAIYIMLVVAETPAKVWVLNVDGTDYDLVAVMGAGSIGFSWDGIDLTTNLPKPEIQIPADQPTATGGIQTL